MEVKFNLGKYAPATRDNLTRKFRRHDVPKNASWGKYHQIIVLTCLRSNVVGMVHDLGHLGVKKTLGRIMKYFWPGMNRDISGYIRECHACQLAGKGSIKHAPLNPIKVTGEPFEKILIDFVGPLPKTKKGNEYLLTIMDPVSRYPEAFPIRSSHSKVIIAKLTEFFTKFGFPEIVQSDQGSNFTSKIFKETLRELGIRQVFSSAYHPESQGALERFHGTLKKMLTKYCFTQEKCWDEGVPLMLYAVRESPQESIGYSPNEVLFGRDISGPLKMVYRSLMEEPRGSKELTRYVSKLKQKLLEVSQFVQENLQVSQEKMKEVHDRKSLQRKFSVGDRVLLFTPTHKSPLTNKFEGPYLIAGKRGKLIILLVLRTNRRKTCAC